MTHTPGPWGLCDDRDNGDVSVVAGQNAKSVAIVEIVDVSGPEREANARLIAAAPDMFAALEAAESILRAYIPGDQWDGHCAAAYQAVGEALVKAKGAHQ